jgi:hypothetical protein
MTQAAPGRPLGQTVEQVVGAAVIEPVHAHGSTSRVSLPVLVGDGEQWSDAGSAASSGTPSCSSTTAVMPADLEGDVLLGRAPPPRWDTMSRR